MKHAPAGPISFLANVLRLPARGMPLKIDADPAQRAALAADHGLLEVRRLHAELLVAPWHRNGVKVTGRVEADIVQECGVTTEPVDAVIDESFEALFVPEGSRLARPPRLEEGEILLDPEGPDAPEVFSGDSIDVGGLAEEFFALAIDPYPRAAGVYVETPVDDGEERGPLYEKLKGLSTKP